MAHKKGHTAWWAILIILFATVLTSTGQIMLKTASARLEFSFIALITNIPLIVGCVLYGSAAILMIIALKYGELSVLYPIIALSFIWISLLSTKYLPVPEAMNMLKWFGIAGIIAGVSLIGFGSQNNKRKVSA